MCISHLLYLPCCLELVLMLSAGSAAFDVCPGPSYNRVIGDSSLRGTRLPTP